MSNDGSTYICPLCHTTNDSASNRCKCEYPLHLLSGPIKPERAAPHHQLWVASARHKASGALIAGWLVQIKGYEKKVFDLFIGANEIGRPSDYAQPDILIYGDPLVSREHAVVDCSVDAENRIRVMITDKSTNGTFVNEKEESPTQRLLHDDDKISLGDSAMVFKSVYMARDHQDALQQVINGSKWAY